MSQGVMDASAVSLAKEKRILISDKDSKDGDKRSVRIEHQNESVKMATCILREVNYSAELAKEILEIISHYDTREGFISKNEGLVRDAEKLSRTSKEGFAVGERRGKSVDGSRLKKIEEGIHKPNYFFSEKLDK